VALCGPVPILGATVAERRAGPNRGPRRNRNGTYDIGLSCGGNRCCHWVPRCADGVAVGVPDHQLELAHCVTAAASSPILGSPRREVGGEGGVHQLEPQTAGESVVAVPDRPST
jgi:hypothetical protein